MENLTAQQVALIIAAVTAGLEIVLRVALRRVKVNQKNPVLRLMWMVAEILLGDDVVMENNPDAEQVGRKLAKKSLPVKAFDEAMKRMGQ